MAQRNSSGRGGTATRTKQQPGNQTPNTPRISESEISRLRVDEIRGQLRQHGVSGISGLRKPELVKTLAKTLRSGGAARRGTGPAGRAKATKAPAGRTSAAKKTESARASTAKAAPDRAKAAPGRGAKAAPGRAKAAPGRAKAAPGRGAKAAPDRAKAGAKKESAGRAEKTRAKKAPAGGGAARRGAREAAGKGSGVRTGPATSRSVRSSQVISSLADRPERPGRSLVTTNHDVIRRWARERGAMPATISGTERPDRAGVLTFDMPGYREGGRIRAISWDEWFRTFDERGLNLIYQEQLRDGRQSNFFRTESPAREDG
ncbi:hypothetical protein GA0070616_1998 [Micromonospora nigra]|uniref:Rho termination factor, N-terminal domain n=1 Tax=Micromonospora nigra TaxID=145857 RepID=A0A1C6RTL0_9ACTN|nr:hypothetical protein [Micromonospora nigra]SCL20513.1 hypothetical protein GA0070616_1998 [Micromonospora nigra]